MKQGLSIITTTIARDRALKGLLSSIENKVGKKIPVIVADQNGRPAPTWLKDYDLALNYAQMPYNCGMGVALNEAVKYCETKYILLLDDDIEFKWVATDRLYNWLEDHPQTGWASPSYISLKDASNTSYLSFDDREKEYLVVAKNFDISNGILSEENAYGQETFDDVVELEPKFVDKPGQPGMYRREALLDLPFEEDTKILRTHLSIGLKFYNSEKWNTAVCPSVSYRHHNEIHTDKKYERLRKQDRNPNQILKDKYNIEGLDEELHIGWRYR